MKCPKGARKKRFAKGRGHPSDYARSLKGHTWEKLFKEINGIRVKIGRRCKLCGKEVLVPEWKEVKIKKEE